MIDSGGRNEATADRRAGDQAGVGEDDTDWPLSIWHGLTEKGAELSRTHQRFALRLHFFAGFLQLLRCSSHLPADSKSALCEQGGFMGKSNPEDV